MYSTLPNFVFGFHGCDKSVYDEVISRGGILNPSENDYDWLGHGVYFWEGNLQRAYEFAEEQKGRNKIRDVAVIGAVLDLGYCLNLMNSESLEIVKKGYETLADFNNLLGAEMPINKGGPDLLLRQLDCSVIQMVHQYNTAENIRQYDSIRGLFTEGDPLYPNAGFKEKNHIQLCIRNPNCIKGYFSPREIDAKHSNP